MTVDLSVILADGEYLRRSGADLIGDIPADLMQAASTAETIAGTVTDKAVPPSGNAGAAPYIDVRRFGAVGDGSANDTVALQNAINAAASEGKPLHLKNGTYLISAAVTLPSSVTIVGNGPYRTRIRNNSTTADFFTATDKIFITIAGIEFDSTVTRTAGCLFNFNNVDHVRLHNLRIIDPYKAGDFQACDVLMMDDIYVVHGGRGFNRGFWFQNCVDTNIRRMTSNMGIQTVPNAQLHFDSGCDTIIVSDSVIACQAGAGGQAEAVAFTHSLSPGNFAPRWARITNLVVESGPTYAGMRIDDALSVYVTNGYFVTSSRGVNIEGGKDLRFTDCLFTNNNLEGARLGVTRAVDIVTFEGCTFSDNGQATTNTYAGAAVGNISGSATFINCYFGDAVIGSTKKQNYGITLSSNNVSLIGPRFGGNATADTGGASLPSVMLEGGAASRKLSFIDVNLYRSSANVLKTDDKLWVALDLQVDGPLDHNGTTAGFYGATPVARGTVPAAATDAATTQALANALRTALVNLGLVT